MKNDRIDAVVRTTEVETIERLRKRLAAIFDRRVDRREVVDVALLQLERSIDAGLPIGPGIPEATFRPHGGRRSNGTGART